MTGTVSVAILCGSVINARGLREALAEKEEFTSNVSHELRTPLNAIIGSLDCLLHSPLSDPQRNLVRTASAASAHMFQLVGELLQFSQLEANVMRLSVKPFPLRDAVHESLLWVAHLARAKGLQLQADIGTDVPRMVLGDRRRLKQMLLNYLANAVKFSPADQNVELVCRLESGGLVSPRKMGPGPSGRPIIRFEVRDFGPGVKAGEVKRLFQPYVQLDPLKPGTGLGLAIVKRFATLMGGESGYRDPADGKGSIFWFTATLPGLPEPDAPNSPPFRLRPADSGRFSVTPPSSPDAWPAELFRRPVDKTRRQTVAALPPSITAATSESAAALTALTAGRIRRQLQLEETGRCAPSTVPFGGGRTLSPLTEVTGRPPMAPPVIARRSPSSASRASPPVSTTFDALPRQLPSVAAVSPALKKILGGGSESDGSSFPPISPQSVGLSDQTVAPAQTATMLGFSSAATVCDAKEPRPTRPIIMVAEDNQFNQNVIMFLLNSLQPRWGDCQQLADVMLVGDGEACIESYLQHRENVRLILMDCQMPRLDGVSACREIRKRELAAGWAPVPIVALTAHAGEVNRTDCLGAGMAAVLTKPIKREDLAAALKLHASITVELGNNESTQSDSPPDRPSPIQTAQLEKRSPP